MKHKQLISRKLELFYTNASEENRLSKGMGVFEFERVKSLIEKYIPSPNATIIDVGGGTGKYAAWLAQKKHHVHLVEPVHKHLQLAEKRARKLKHSYHIHKGEARNLKFPDNYADLVILHGPLYHLQNESDRHMAITEARRILKQNGIILGFAINYTASTLVGLLNGLIHKPPFFEICKEELSTGMHAPSNEYPWLLAEAYYHTPEKLKTEFRHSNLTYMNMYAVEGMAWLDKNFFSNLQNEKKKQTLLELIKLTQNDQYLLSFSPHMMIAVKKQSHYGR
jgi:ubiquinone/menaquinone biosynthesis C-methylase UbiE